MPYPVSLVHGDKPDFQLTTNGHVVAIEAVEAVSQVQAHKTRVIGGLVASGVMANPIQSVVLRKPTDQPLTNAQAAIPDLGGDGYVGDTVEVNWTEAMKHFIGGKLAKFASYAVADEKWLMVYDNWDSICLDLRKASRHVQDWLIQSNAFNVLDMIFIIHNSALVEFNVDGFIIRPLKIPKTL